MYLLPIVQNLTIEIKYKYPRKIHLLDAGPIVLQKGPENNIIVKPEQN